MNNSSRLVSTLLRTSYGQNKVAVRNMSGLPPLGKKQFQQLQNWIPSLSLYGVTAFTLMVYFTDWRVVTDFIPFYNGKYKKEE